MGRRTQKDAQTSSNRRSSEPAQHRDVERTGTRRRFPSDSALMDVVGHDESQQTDPIAALDPRIILQLQKSVRAKKRIMIPTGMAAGALIMSIAFYLLLPCLQESMSFDNCAESQSIRHARLMSEISLPLDFSSVTSLEDFMGAVGERVNSFRTDFHDLLKKELRPGITDEFKNRSVVHPVVMIPGFTGSRLEVWEGADCMNRNFRDVIWGGTSMFKHLLNPECWFRHMSMDETTGGDPTDPISGRPIRVRPAEGFAASDYFFEGYYVWGPIIENLADLGYDTKSMVLVAFDWRLSPLLNEKRDRWFTRLKHRIESIVSINGKPAVVPTHSYGSIMFFYFLQWVGGFDEHWASRNIHAHFSIGGSMLGLLKAVSGYLSGESAETAVLPPRLSHILAFLHRVFDTRHRVNMIRTFTSTAAMLPQGGEIFWPGSMLRVRDVQSNSSQTSNLTITDSLRLLEEQFENIDRMRDMFPDYHSKRPQKRQMHNVLTNPLPGIKNVYCVYGVGVPTERSFEYVKDGSNYYLDLEHNQVVEYSDGDGTVPLHSLGYACHLWKKSKWHNPSNARAIIREKKHDPQTFVETQGDLRGGSTAGTHVDIMGNHNMIRDLLLVALGEQLEEEIISNISEMSNEIDEKLGADFFEDPGQNDDTMETL
eukprot:GEMP01019785.1.p1 GENE.GEMP01019785.1~~GEMP01019785.1.p1  ORF type:complete len:664 (+),score=81.53 GEMP01019785.1:36-1994(+)